MKIDRYEIRLLPKDEPCIIDKGKAELILHGDPVCYVGFTCPCGCGSPTYLPVEPSEARVKWSLSKEDDGTFSLSPSIQHMDGCKSHYFIKHQRVQWC